MPNPRFVRTGDPSTDRQLREMAHAGRSYTATITVAGIPRPIIKAVSHMLGCVPGGWHISREMPAEGVTGRPTEVSGGLWSNSAVDILFPGNGTWSITFTA